MPPTKVRRKIASGGDFVDSTNAENCLVELTFDELELGYLSQVHLVHPTPPTSEVDE